MPIFRKTVLTIGTLYGTGSGLQEAVVNFNKKNTERYGQWELSGFDRFIYGKSK